MAELTHRHALGALKQAKPTGERGESMYKPEYLSEYGRGTEDDEPADFDDAAWDPDDDPDFDVDELMRLADELLIDDSGL